MAWPMCLSVSAIPVLMSFSSRMRFAGVISCDAMVLDRAASHSCAVPTDCVAVVTWMFSSRRRDFEGCRKRGNASLPPSRTLRLRSHESCATFHLAFQSPGHQRRSLLATIALPSKLIMAVQPPPPLRTESVGPASAGGMGTPTAGTPVGQAPGAGSNQNLNQIVSQPIWEARVASEQEGTRKQYVEESRSCDSRCPSNRHQQHHHRRHSFRRVDLNLHHGDAAINIYRSIRIPVRFSLVQAKVLTARYPRRGDAN